MKTAIYLRISSEDEDLRTGEKNESESISTIPSLSSPEQRANAPKT